MFHSVVSLLFLIVFVLLQISKLSMIPVVCVLEWLLHGKGYTREVKTAVLIVMLGVGICTVTDVSVNLKGTVTAVIAILSTSLQQIVSTLATFANSLNFFSDLHSVEFYGLQFIGSLQKKYNIGSFDLLSKTAPMQAGSLLLFGPFVDYILTGRNLLGYSLTWGACVSFLHSVPAVQCLL